MADPWNTPPLPDHGDDDIDSTFAGVGRVLSQWESVELELCVLYALFSRRVDDPVARQEYGKGRIFAERVKPLEDLAEKWLQHQALECEFGNLIIAIRHFADRRNDVAHGIVRPIHWVFPFQQTDYNFQYGLVPPYYDYKRYGLNNLPKYMYIRQMLDDLERKLFYLSAELTNFRTARILALRRS